MRHENQERPELAGDPHPKYCGKIVGWIRRHPKMTAGEGLAKAKTMPWYRPDLVMDSRCIRWYCWRER